MKSRWQTAQTLVLIEILFFSSSAAALGADCVYGCKDTTAYLTDGNWPDWECIRWDPANCTEHIWGVNTIYPSRCDPSYTQGNMWACNGCVEVCSNEAGLEREADYIESIGNCELIHEQWPLAHCGPDGHSGR